MKQLVITCLLLIISIPLLAQQLFLHEQWLYHKKDTLHITKESEKNGDVPFAFIPINLKKGNRGHFNVHAEDMNIMVLIQDPNGNPIVHFGYEGERTSAFFQAEEDGKYYALFYGDSTRYYGNVIFDFHAIPRGWKDLELHEGFCKQLEFMLRHAQVRFALMMGESVIVQGRSGSTSEVGTNILPDGASYSLITYKYKELLYGVINDLEQTTFQAFYPAADSTAAIALFETMQDQIIECLYRDRKPIVYRKGDMVHFDNHSKELPVWDINPGHKAAPDDLNFWYNHIGRVKLQLTGNTSKQVGITYKKEHGVLLIVE